MKLRNTQPRVAPRWPDADAAPLRTRPHRAFTMVEIAICLAVIGFALVAIIGVLPSAMNFQRDNREETIIDQDATYWVEAIRGAAKGLDHLTSRVERVTLTWTNYLSGNRVDEEYVYGGNGLGARQFRDGYELIGLIGTAAYRGFDRDYWWAEADVNALSGPAVERETTEVGMKYRMTVEIQPLLNWNPVMLQQNPGLSNILVNVTNSIVREIQLQFEWPLVSENQTRFRSRKVYRSIVHGALTNEFPTAATQLSFFER